LSDDDDTAPDFDERLPEPDDVGERRRVERKKAKAEREREEEIGFWRDCLATPIGRRAFYKLFEQSGLWEQPFACGPNGFPQPEATWFRGGERALAKRIHDFLQQIDHGAVYDLLCENHPAFATAPRRAVKYG
jgi:hypothetical protein